MFESKSRPVAAVEQNTDVPRVVTKSQSQNEYYIILAYHTYVLLVSYNAFYVNPNVFATTRCVPQHYIMDAVAVWNVRIFSTISLEL